MQLGVETEKRIDALDLRVAKIASACQGLAASVKKREQQSKDQADTTKRRSTSPLHGDHVRFAQKDASVFS